VSFQFDRLVEATFSLPGQQISGSRVLVPGIIRTSAQTCLDDPIPDVRDIQGHVEIVAIRHEDAPVSITLVVEDG
jgi:hypothetical protein